jgi:hypothetical protein
VFFTEVPTALVALVIYTRRDDVLGDRAGAHGLFLGLLTGLLLLMHIRSVGLVLGLAGLILWRVRLKPRPALAFVIGLAAMCATKVALNEQFWGTAVTTPLQQLGAWHGTHAFSTEVALRCLGMLFDARHGLLLSAPIYLLVPGAWVVLARRSRAASIELLFPIVGYLIFVVLPVINPYGWRGGWSPAARFLVPITPFLALGLPTLAAEPQRLRFRLVAAVVLLQLLLDAFFWGHPMWHWSEGPGPAPFVEAMLGRSVAVLLPVWESLSGRLLLASLFALGRWTTLTLVLVKSASVTPASTPAVRT